MINEKKLRFLKRSFFILSRFTRENNILPYDVLTSYFVGTGVPDGPSLPLKGKA